MNCEIYQFLYSASVKSDMEKYLEYLKLDCSFFKPEKVMYYLSVKFHCCFFFTGKITMVETGPALVFQDCCPGLKKIR